MTIEDHDRDVRCITVLEFCKRFSVSRDMFNAEQKAGRLITRRAGTRVLIDVGDADKWFKDLPVNNPK